MRLLFDDRLIPEAVFKLRVSLFAELMMGFKPITKKIKETVQPEIMPLSSLCHAFILSLTVKRIKVPVDSLNVVRYVNKFNRSKVYQNK